MSPDFQNFPSRIQAHDVALPWVQGYSILGIRWCLLQYPKSSNLGTTTSELFAIHIAAKKIMERDIAPLNSKSMWSVWLL